MEREQCEIGVQEKYYFPRDMRGEGQRNWIVESVEHFLVG
jgi:hypothetical protein